MCYVEFVQNQCGCPPRLYEYWHCPEEQANRACFTKRYANLKRRFHQLPGKCSKCKSESIKRRTTGPSYMKTIEERRAEEKKAEEDAEATTPRNIYATTSQWTTLPPKSDKPSEEAPKGRRRSRSHNVDSYDAPSTLQAISTDSMNPLGIYNPLPYNPDWTLPSTSFNTYTPDFSEPEPEAETEAEPRPLPPLPIRRPAPADIEDVPRLLPSHNTRRQPSRIIGPREMPSTTPQPSPARRHRRNIAVVDSTSFQTPPPAAPPAPSGYEVPDFWFDGSQGTPRREEDEDGLIDLDL